MHDGRLTQHTQLSGLGLRLSTAWQHCIHRGDWQDRSSRPTHGKIQS